MQNSLSRSPIITRSNGLAADTGELSPWSINVYGTMVPEPSTIGLMSLGTAIAVMKGLRTRRRHDEIAA